MRCREASATSSLITDSAKTSHASQPTMVISPTRIMPSTGVNRARRTALQVSSSGSGLPPRKAKATGTPAVPSSRTASEPRPRMSRAINRPLALSYRSPFDFLFARARSCPGSCCLPHSLARHVRHVGRSYSKVSCSARSSRQQRGTTYPTLANDPSANTLPRLSGDGNRWVLSVRWRCCQLREVSPPQRPSRHQPTRILSIAATRKMRPKINAGKVI